MRPSCLLLVSIVVAVVAQAPSSWAQEAPRSLELHLRASPTPPAAVPLPPPEVVEKDADEAAAAILSRQRAEEAAREAARASERRPDLHHDVVQGVQSLGIRDALRRR